MKPIRSVLDVKTNGELLAALKPLWFPDYLGFPDIPEDDWVDVTFHTGGWWTVLEPPNVCSFLGHGGELAKGDGIDGEWTRPLKSYDYRNLPFEDGSIAGIFADPPYAPPGGRDTSTVKEMHEAYGMGGMPRTPQGTFLDHRRLIMEAGRVVAPKGRLVFKCADFITNGKYWSGLGNAIEIAPLAGWRLEDIVIHESGTGPQPKSRMVKCPECGGTGERPDRRGPCPECEGVGKIEKLTEQQHTRRAHSYLILFVRETWR